MKKIQFLIVLFVIVINANAQEVAEYYNLNEPLVGDLTRDLVASEYINLQYNYTSNSGFHITPEVGYYFHASIDPQMVLPPWKSEWGGTNENNSGGGVGLFKGEYMVNNFGALEYSIPLDLPEGLAGLKPNINLVYNSQAGNGIMGDGWALTGLSVISRVPYTYYYNNFTSSVNMTNADQLMLDGNYLVEVESSSLQYRTEIETFDKIIAVDGNINNGFVVLKKNGLKYEYGTDLGSKYYIQTSDQPIAWYLKKITDLNSNYVEFNYINDRENGDMYPDYILYTGNEEESTDPFYKIKFNYREVERSNSPKKYVENFEDVPLYTKTTKLLNEIEIIYVPESHTLKKYNLYYEQIGELGRDYLVSIYPNFNLMERTTRWLNPLRFKWNISDFDYGLKEKDLFLMDIDAPFSNIVQENVFSTQFDDNPKTDLLFVANNIATNEKTIKGYKNQSNYYGDENTLLFDFTYNTFNHTFREDNSVFINPGDFNGNGKDEIVRVTQNSEALNIYLGEIDFSSAGSYNEVLIDGPLYINTSDKYPTIFFVGDFSGNGMDDLCILSIEGISSYKAVFRLSEKNNPMGISIENSGFAIDLLKKTLLGDFNGNGKKELMLIGDSRSVVVSLTEDNSSFVIYESNIDFSGMSSNNNIVAGDFNSDAKTDLVLLTNDVSDNWKYYLSYGKGLFINEFTKTNDGIGGDSYQVFAVDVNGDGYDDICRVKKDFVEEGDYDYYKYFRKDFLTSFSNNDLELVEKVFEEPIQVVQYPSERQQVNYCFGNFSGNNSSQLISSRMWSNTRLIYANIDLSGPIYSSFHNEIDNFEDSYGNDINITYHPLTGIPILTLDEKSTTEEYDFKFPIIQYPSLLQIVTKVDKEFDQDNFLSTHYYYETPLYHRIGKGFLGFTQIRIIDDLNLTNTTKDFNIDNPYFHLVNNSTLEEIILYGGSLNVREVTNEFSFLAADNVNFTRYLPLPIEEEVHNYELTGELSNAVRKTYSNYDAYGNPKDITEEYSSDLVNWSISKSASINYINLTSDEKYILGLPDDKVVTYNYSNKPEVVQTTDYEYYTEGDCRLKMEHFEPNNSVNFSNNFIYDGFGNITRKTVSGTDEPDRVFETVYTQNGRFPEISINPLGHKTVFSFYEKSGLPKTTTDANNLTTTYSKYDIFGRLKETILPDGNKESTVYMWSVPGTLTENELAPETAIYYKWIKKSGSEKTITFFDTFNRKVRTVNYLFDGTITYQDYTYYDAGKITAGLLKSESLPYKQNEEVYYLSYYYDSYKRPKIINYPDGSSSKYEYETRKVTFTDVDDQTTEKIINAAGWVTDVVNNTTGNIKFDYTSDGLVDLAMINNDFDTRISKTYNAFRKLETLDDPNRSKENYVYNCFGELTNKYDNLNSTTYVYDKLGRKIWQESSDGFSMWEYDTKDNGIGMLGSMGHAPSYGDFYQVVYDYNYDDLSRLESIKQMMDVDQLEFDYTYDVFSRQESTIWPSRFITKNFYNDNGDLLYMTDENLNVLWKLIEQNQYGDPSVYELGEFVTTNEIIDPLNGKITDIVSTIGENTIQNLHYNWLLNGNLDYREDFITSNKEEFVYDVFNRLNESYLNQSLQTSVNYNGLGNITYKSDVGTYKYEEAELHPHAVTGIDQTPETISRLLQTADYTTFDKIFHLTETDTEDNNNEVYSLDITYDGNNNRAYQIFRDNKKNTSISKRYFKNSYEKIENQNNEIKELHYLKCPTGIFATFTINDDGTSEINYLLKDHLESIVQILDEDGNLLQKMNFDAWGRRRDPSTWSFNGSENEQKLIDRGFTFHEHYDQIKLINMNGRMYDPVIGRFLSTDPLIQLPEYNQSYNRYSYALNNPLKYTDPSGFAFVQNMDWFINEITGDVYYNSDLKKGDEKQMGEGWKHFAENDKFSLKGESDLQALTGNMYLTEFRYLNTTNGSAEAYFKGKNAEAFMNKQGYFKRRNKYEHHMDVETHYFPDAMISPVTQTYDYSTSKPLTYQYISKKQYLTKTAILDKYKEPQYGRPTKYAWFDPHWFIRDQTWTIRQDIYSESPSNQKGEIIMELFEDTKGIWQPGYEEFWKNILKYKK